MMLKKINVRNNDQIFLYHDVGCYLYLCLEGFDQSETIVICNLVQFENRISNIEKRNDCF